MHVVTHLLAGWALAEQTKLEPRETFTLALMIYGLWFGVRRGRTPVELFSVRADARLVALLRARFSTST